MAGELALHSAGVIGYESRSRASRAQFLIATLLSELFHRRFGRGRSLKKDLGSCVFSCGGRLLSRLCRRSDGHR